MIQGLEILVEEPSCEQSLHAVLPRIVVEESEAWLIGDVSALRCVYPRIPASLGERDRFRDPDAVTGGTAEALEWALQRHGYHVAGLAKVANAAQVGQFMDVERNRSASFGHFRDGLRKFPLSEEPSSAS